MPEDKHEAWLYRFCFLFGALVTVGYFTASKWAIRHETITFYDPDRGNRPVAVDIAVRRDKEMQADAGMIRLPVAIITLQHGEVHRILLPGERLRRARPLVVSIQHDTAGAISPPMVVFKVGEPYVGRLAQIERGVANIKFAIAQMRQAQPNADYDHVTMVGHSMGGDITMYFAKQYPDEIKKVVTLDNLRVPFVTSGKGRRFSRSAPTTRSSRPILA